MKKLTDCFAKFSKIKEIIFPNHFTCDCCTDDLFTKKHTPICDNCFETLPFIVKPCQKCGKETFGKKCEYCYKTKSIFTRAYAPLRYEVPVSGMIFRFKYNQEFHLVNIFTTFLIWKYSTLTISPDCVISVPMHKHKELVRVKNHSELLTNEFCKRLQLFNASDKIIKFKQTTQTNLKPIERFINVKNSLRVLDREYFKNKQVLIIDDVLTTGSTANALADVLRECGAKNVYLLTICTS